MRASGESEVCIWQCVHTSATSAVQVRSWSEQPKVALVSSWMNMHQNVGSTFCCYQTPGMVISSLKNDEPRDDNIHVVPRFLSCSTSRLLQRHCSMSYLHRLNIFFFHCRFSGQ